MACGTGAMDTFGGKKLPDILRRFVRFGGITRPATGTATRQRIGT